MRPLVFVQAFLIFAIFLFPASKVLTPFPGLANPTAVIIDNNQLFITEGVTISIYSLNDFKLQKKFGKSGYEAHEFKPYEPYVTYENSGIQMYIEVLPHCIMVESFGRISYFTRRGDFIELIQPRDFFKSVKPLGENFVTQRNIRRNNTLYICLDLYNSRFEKCIELLRIKNDLQVGERRKILTRSWSYCTHGNRLFTAVKKDFIIDVFDHQGEIRFSIAKEYQKVKVTTAYIKSWLENAKKVYRERPELYNYFERAVLFPGYFPAISHLHADNGVLYARTWRREKEKTEFYLFDMAGKLIKTIFLPLAQENDAKYYPSSFHRGKLYQLVKNRDKNIWELHETLVNRAGMGKK
jgi:hypothetical protein